jgi:hypothetical protein
MIKEIKLSSLNNVIPKVNKKETPRSVNNDLTPFFFTSMFIGSKNSGKSYGLVKMIKNYEEQPVKDSKGNILEIRTILFCPTGNSNFNSIYKSLKTLDQENDIILDYSDDKLLEILDNIAEEEKEIKEYYKYLKSYERFKKNKMKDKDLLFLDKYDFQDPEDLLNEKNNLLKMMKPKYKQYRANFLIFDDLVGDPRAFKRNNGRLNNLTIKCRHHHCSMLFTTQYPKAIPPTIRANIDTWVLFRFASKERV